MKYFYFIGKFIHVLSLDISFGATIMAVFVSGCFDLDVPFIQFLMLFQAVWAIYLADHLYDARRKEAVTVRRLFFARYRNPATILFIFNLLFLLMLFFIWGTSRILIFSIPVAVITILYLLLNWYAQTKGKMFYAKEIMIAIGYSCGVMVIPFSNVMEIDPLLWWVAAFIFMLAGWNVLMIAYFEEQSNEQEGQTSMQQWLSTYWITRVAVMLIIIFFGLLLISGFLFEIELKEMVTWVAMGIWCLIVWGARDKIRRQRNYMLWVDTVFILPLIFLLPKF